MQTKLAESDNDANSVFTVVLRR
uniref:Uncharacterized protein n=1 Tax=Arundo donax TaxID=35708 RepID=A0A0A9BK19_ARUDO